MPRPREMQQPSRNAREREPERAPPPRKSGRDRVDDMLSGYEGVYGGRKGARRGVDFEDALRTHNGREDPSCGCMGTKLALGLSCLTSFVFGIALVGVAGFTLNQLDFARTDAWRALLIVVTTVGVFICVLSVIGAVAMRTAARPLLVFYFIIMAMLGALIFGAAIFAWAQSSKIDEFLDLNWKRIQSMFALHTTKEEVIRFVKKQLDWFCALLAILLIDIIAGITAAARLAGTGYTFVATNFLLLLIGIASGIVGFVVHQNVIPAMYYMLYCVSAMLCVSSICGIVGAVELSKKGFVASFVLLAACTICFFVMAGWAYPKLTEGSVHWRELAILLGMGLVAGYWTLLSLILGAAHYGEIASSMQERTGR
mmetsp:Transcript_13391/g.34123  ORF Transcript_13391/g.34123 Transcript_13391/m.34123 type:complete len:370 (-) Transcript_13391:200-1309(-)